MVTALLGLAILFVAISVVAFEKYQKSKLVASLVDGAKIDTKKISPEAQEVIDYLVKGHHLGLNKLRGTIMLPNQYYIGIPDNGFKFFRAVTDLGFEPTELEWEVLFGVTKKIFK